LVKGADGTSFGRRNEASSRALQLRIELPEAAFDSVEEMKPLRGLCSVMPPARMQMIENVEEMKPLRGLCRALM
jgi:hypothetical protein